MPTATLSCIADSRIYSPSTGEGLSAYLAVGLWSGQKYRSLLKFTLPNWSGLGIIRVTEAHIRVRNSPQNYVARGASPRVLVQRITENWIEGVASSLSATNAVRYDNQPAAVTTSQVDSGIISTVDWTWINIDLTAIVRSWAPAAVENSSGNPNYGIRILSYDEASTSRTTEFLSSESSSPPQLIITYEDNTAPNAPTGLTPAVASNGVASVASVTTALPSQYRPTPAREITVTAALNDPDPGDYLTAAQVQIFADSASDAVPGTPIVDQTITLPGAPTSFSAKITVDALTIGTTYRSRVRTADRKATWGAWSSLLAMRWIPDTLPGAPANPAQDVSTQTPTFYGSLVDVDAGATIAEVQILVRQDTSSGSVLKWDSGFVASGGTRFAIAYGGSTLDFGTKYRWSARIKDNVGGIGPYGAYAYWTPSSAVGPDNMTPRSIETKQNSLTPALTIAHSSAFDAYELEVARFDGGPADMWDVGVTTHASTSSKPVTYAGAILTWGRVFYWRSKVRVGGTTWTEWSPWFPFYVNALPYAPAVSISGAVDSGLGLYGTYVTVVGTTPTISAAFADPDLEKGYADVPTNKQIEIRRADTNAVHGSYSPATVAGTASTAVVSPAMTAGLTYMVRVRWQDSASQYGPWSAWLLVKISTTLTITVGAAPSNSDPTPTFAWTLNRTQKALRVVVSRNDTGEVVHDSGVLASVSTSYTMPPGRLGSGLTYRYVVTAYDSDNLSAVLT